MAFSIYNAVKKAFRPSPKLPVDEWLKKNVYLDRGHIIGPLDINNSPWLREPLSDLRDHRIREIILTCSVQSGKTLFVEGSMLYLIAEDPGEMGFYAQTDEAADRFLDKRFKHRILKCEPVKSLLLRGERSIQKMSVDYAHMTQFVLGAHNEQNVQSLSLRYVFGDESAYWLDGRTDEARKRTTTYDDHNSKKVFIGTPLDNIGDFYESFNKGTRSEWHVACPTCGEGQAPRMKHLKWEGEGVKLLDGSSDVSKIMEYVRFVCEHCGAEHKDEPITRRKMIEKGYYVSENPNPNPTIKSYHWNQLCVPWVKWASIAADFAHADLQKKKGNLIPLAEFVRKRLGEFWDLKLSQTEDVRLSGNYVLGEDWDREAFRYMAIDVQKDYNVVVIRQFALSGASRLVWADKVGTWSQVRDLQERFKVQSRRTFIDCGFQRSEADVYRQCATFGWIALKGDRAKFFTFRVLDRKTQRINTIKRPYSPIEKIDSGVGLRRDMVNNKKADLCDRIMFAADYMRLLLHRLRAGQGETWEVADAAPDWYFTEVANEVFVTEKDKKTGKLKSFFKKLGDNHAHDCESMILVGACIDKLIGSSELSDHKELLAEATDDVK